MISDLVLRPEEVVGYDGCSQAAAAALLAGGSWRQSANVYDWLGEGIYLWEYAPYRALLWTQERYGTDAAVLKATVRLGRCLNLLDTGHQESIRRLYFEAQRLSAAAGVPLPVNTPLGAHFLDCFVVNRYCQFVEQERDALGFQTVRGCFPEGGPIFPGSKILMRAHVQVAVRDPSCIVDLGLVSFPQNA